MQLKPVIEQCCKTCTGATTQIVYVIEFEQTVLSNQGVLQGGGPAPYSTPCLISHILQSHG